MNNTNSFAVGNDDCRNAMDTPGLLHNLINSPFPLVSRKDSYANELPEEGTPQGGVDHDDEHRAFNFGTSNAYQPACEGHGFVLPSKGHPKENGLFMVSVCEHGSGAGWFSTTHWSVVLAAGHDSSPGAREALERLCRTYWYPLYAYVRRQGHTPEDSEDLTQEFFARLLAGKDLAGVAPGKGKFRSFLLAAMNHFLANEWDRVKAVKRGGRLQFVSLDEPDAEWRFQQEPATSLSPEKIFERRWAAVLLEGALARLRQEAEMAGRLQQFEGLKVFLSGERPGVSYATLATRLHTTEGALKMAVQRLRRRCGQLLREQIAQTVGSADQVEEEVRWLFAVLGA